MGTFKTSYRRLGQDRASPSPALLDLALCLHSSDRPSVSDVGIGVGFRFGFSFGLGFGIHSMVAWVRPSSRRHSLLHAPRLRPCHRARSTCTVQGRAVEILVTDRQTDRTDRPYRPTDRLVAAIVCFLDLNLFLFNCSITVRNGKARNAFWERSERCLSSVHGNLGESRNKNWIKAHTSLRSWQPTAT